MGLFGRLGAGLARVLGRVGVGGLDEEALEELEEALVAADVGVGTAMALVDKIRASSIREVGQVRRVLVGEIERLLAGLPEPPERTSRPHVIMVVGVNGVGKTTTIAKLAHWFQAQGRSVLLAAADTFRAAAVDQLKIWAERVGCDVVAHQEGSDPGAVVFDALEAAAARGRDIVIIDTAGRLHTRGNLMDELKKIRRVAAGRLPGAPHETLLVLDATTGQNAIAQAKGFSEAIGVDGVVLAKMDSTARGGVVLAIASELVLPVVFVGTGERLEDLREFNPREFARALVGLQG